MHRPCGELGASHLANSQETCRADNSARKQGSITDYRLQPSMAVCAPARMGFESSCAIIHNRLPALDSTSAKNRAVGQMTSMPGGPNTINSRCQLRGGIPSIQSYRSPATAVSSVPCLRAERFGRAERSGPADLFSLSKALRALADRADVHQSEERGRWQVSPVWWVVPGLAGAGMSEMGIHGQPLIFWSWRSAHCTQEIKCLRKYLLLGHAVGEYIEITVGVGVA
jgi:hypothetical protein